MRPMCRVLALLLLLTFSACMSAPMQKPAADAPVVHASIVWQENDNPVFLSAAQQLAMEVYDLSGGMLQLTVQTASTHAGAQLYFADGNADVPHSRYLPLLQAPFRYASYDAFTAQANNPSTLALLEQDLRENAQLVPLAAFYTGSTFLLSRVSLTGSRAFAQEKPAVRTYAVLPDSGTDRMLQTLGASGVTEPQREVRLQLLQQDSVQLAEFTVQELETLQADLSGLYYTRPFHTIVPRLLVADAAFFDALPEASRAALLEGCATLFPAVDGACLQREEELAVWLEQNGATASRAFSAAKKVKLPETVEAQGAHFLRVLRGTTVY